MIQRPIYIDPAYDGAQMGSWLSKAFKKTVGWAVGKGNTPGTPETRKYGYDREATATAIVEQIKNAPPVAPNNGKVILLGAAGAAVLLLLTGDKKRRR